MTWNIDGVVASCGVESILKCHFIRKVGVSLRKEFDGGEVALLGVPIEDLKVDVVIADVQRELLEIYLEGIHVSFFEDELLETGHGLFGKGVVGIIDGEVGILACCVQMLELLVRQFVHLRQHCRVSVAAGVLLQVVAVGLGRGLVCQGGVGQGTFLAHGGIVDGFKVEVSAEPPVNFRFCGRVLDQRVG